MALPLGACIENVQGNNKILRSRLSLQTYKSSTVIDLNAQGYSDTLCKKKLGKPEKLVSANNEECVNGQWGMSSSVTSYTKPTPQYTADGMVVTEFLGSSCGGSKHVNPTSLNYYSNNMCTNNTLSGSALTQSMMVNSDAQYVYEYAEPNCMGMSNYISLVNVRSCLNYGTHSSLVKTAPGPGWFYFGTNDIPVNGYFTYSISVVPGSNSVDFDVRTISGSCSMYVSLQPYPTPWSYTWSSGPAGDHAYIHLDVLADNLSQMAVYIAIYGNSATSANHCRFGYANI